MSNQRYGISNEGRGLSNLGVDAQPSHPILQRISSIVQPTLWSVQRKCRCPTKSSDSPTNPIDVQPTLWIVQSKCGCPTKSSDCPTTPVYCPTNTVSSPTLPNYNPPYLLSAPLRFARYLGS